MDNVKKLTKDIFEAHEFAAANATTGTPGSKTYLSSLSKGLAIAFDRAMLDLVDLEELEKIKNIDFSKFTAGTPAHNHDTSYIKISDIDKTVQSYNANTIIGDANGNVSLAGELDMNDNTVSFTMQIIESSSGTAVFDWKKGNKAKITLTENTTLDFADPTNPCAVQILFVQDTITRVVTWPSNIKWPNGAQPTISTGSGEIDIVSLLFDGTEYYGTFGQNFI